MEHITFADINKEIEWVMPGCRKHKANSDVSITAGKDLDRVTITFRNELWKCVTLTDYVKFGVIKNRIVFAEGEERTGFKLVKSKGTEGSRYLYIGHKPLVEFEGDYELKYESFHDYYYIEKES